MKYFNDLNKIFYEDSEENLKVAVDIFNRVRVRLEAQTDRAIYYEYQIKDGDTPEIEDSFGAGSLGVKECCDDSEKYAEQSGWDQSLDRFQVTKDDARKDWDEKFDVPDDLPQDAVEITKEQREAKDKINQEIMKLIMYRSQRKWYATISIIAIFGGLLVMMLSFIAMQRDLMPEWKEVLLVLLGAFVGSFSRVIDHWFNNSQAEEKLLESAND